MPGATTLTIAGTVVLAIPRGVQSMADHLGFLFGYGAAGLPGFPNPFNRHDPNKPNDSRVNGRHIRNALRDIKENLGNSDLQTFLEQHCTPEQIESFTKAFDSLTWDLTEQGYLYEQIGADYAQEILTLLTEMGWPVPTP
jgi:hypothetical protein